MFHYGKVEQRPLNEFAKCVIYSFALNTESSLSHPQHVPVHPQLAVDRGCAKPGSSQFSLNVLWAPVDTGQLPCALM